MADSTVLEPGVNDLPEALQIPAKAVSTGFQFLLSLANLVVWLSILPISQILLPTQVAALDAANKFSNLSIAVAIGVLAVLLVLPRGCRCDPGISLGGRARPGTRSPACHSIRFPQALIALRSSH